MDDNRVSQVTFERLSIDDSRASVLGQDEAASVARRRRQRSVTVSGGEASRSMLVDTLMNPEKAHYFKDFLEKEHNNENMLFWIHVEEFQALAKRPHDQSELRDKAQEIYDMFVATDAPQSVNLSSVNRTQIVNSLARDIVPFTLFDNAKSEVFRLMEADPFPRFLRSMSFLCMLSGKYQLPPRLFEEFDLQVEGNEQQGWKLMKEKNGFKSMRKSLKNNASNAVLAKCDIMVPRDKVVEALLSNDLETRRKFDPMVTKYTTIEQVSDNMSVIYMRFQKKAFFMSRDAVMLRVHSVDPRGTAYVIARSVVHKDYPAEATEKGVQRVEVEASGFRIDPIPGPDGTPGGASRMSYLNQARIGQLKPMIGKQISKRRAKTLKKLKQYLEGNLPPPKPPSPDNSP